jgi:hypothetical protein
MKANSAFLQAFRRITEFSCFEGKDKKIHEVAEKSPQQQLKVTRQ